MTSGKELVEHVHPSRPDYEERDAADWWNNRPRYKRVMNSTLLLAQVEHLKLNAMHPTCDVCGKPVERFDWVLLPGEMNVEFVVRCHGETEKAKLSLMDVSGLVNEGVTGGRAFVKLKRLT